MTASIHIVGASARAAAFSALRAGWQPVVADLFADADLAAAGIPAERIDDYPAGLALATEQAPPGPWLYTGALENYPRLVGQMARQRELLGNGPAVLAAVRDPLQLAQAFAQQGLAHPTVEAGTQVERLPRDGTWLSKPLRGAAGHGILPWDEETSGVLERWQIASSYYFQQRLVGQPRSAVFVGHSAGALLLGVTEQLTGTPWCGGRPFGYCGSLGPLRLSDAEQQAWQRIGECLVERFGLRGLFGADAIENEAGIWPVEVNPRYTASVEILEGAAPPTSPLHTIALHIAACRGEPLPSSTAPSTAPMHGKAILFAQADYTIAAEFTRHALAARDIAARDLAGWPCYADVPHPGTAIATGHPVCTIFAQAATQEATMAALQTRQAELRDRLSTAAAKVGGCETTGARTE